MPSKKRTTVKRNSASDKQAKYIEQVNAEHQVKLRAAEDELWALPPKGQLAAYIAEQLDREIEVPDSRRVELLKLSGFSDTKLHSDVTARLMDTHAEARRRLAAIDAKAAREFSIVTTVENAEAGLRAMLAWCEGAPMIGEDWSKAGWWTFTEARDFIKSQIKGSSESSAASVLNRWVNKDPSMKTGERKTARFDPVKVKMYCKTPPP